LCDPSLRVGNVTPISFSQAAFSARILRQVHGERGYDSFWMAEHHFQPEGTELSAGRRGVTEE
jgi:alkanesulfonate monooxygenase SsuD/methylene tetrahydromethanopterin reductase-like flavin-dependent oxidoreductase (luciferase family)